MRMRHVAATALKLCKEESVAVADVVSEMCAMYGNSKFTDGFLEAKRVYERGEDGEDS